MSSHPSGDKEPDPGTPGGGGGESIHSPSLQRAREAAEAANLQAIMEDMEGRYFELRRERDALQEKVTSLETEKQTSQTELATMASLRQEKATLTNQIRQEEIKSKGLQQEKTLMQERMDRMQVEADQLREELRYAVIQAVWGERV
jgi:chromosome segregation ATPase